MSAGHIRPRGKTSWELKFEAGRDPATGKRKIQYASFRGTKRQARIKLAELIAAVGGGTYVEPSKLTVAEHVRARIDQWEASGAISARTAQRYRQLARGSDRSAHRRAAGPEAVDSRHRGVARDLTDRGRSRGGGGVSPRTVVHAHRVLSHALDDAARHGVMPRNVAKLQPPPEGPGRRDGHSRPRRDRRDHHASCAAMQCMRRRSWPVHGHEARRNSGPAVAERGSRQCQDDLRPRSGSRKPRRTAFASRRRRQRPADGTSACRTSWWRRFVSIGGSNSRCASRLASGRPPTDALVFPTLDGGPQAPSAVSRSWGIVAAGLGLADITLHALRHSHTSQLIDAGVDIVTISKRLGHASPDVTLRVYAHLFRRDDGKAAAAINAALAGPAGA